MLTKKLRERRQLERSETQRTALTTAERNRVIRASLGHQPVCIADIMVKKFGRERFVLWLRRKYFDPEMDELYITLDEMAKYEWTQLGVDPDVGPFVE